MKQILVLNSGSSSIKYELFDMDRVLVLESGVIERIGESTSLFRRSVPEANEPGLRTSATTERRIQSHREGIGLMRSTLAESEAFADGAHLIGIGHRVVHGGDTFSGPAIIDDSVIEAIRGLAPLAPLHNPANLTGIEVSRSAFPDVGQVAVFDTAFHQTIPSHAFHYAIPREYYERYRIRRYGFHGTSHRYVTTSVADTLNRSVRDLNLIILHLGNGASSAAIQCGKCVDTSMGLTPLEGLVMGTRSGDIDPAVTSYLGAVADMSFAQIDHLLNKESGLKGLCGENDMREVIQLAESGDASAELALNVFVYRIRKYIGAYHAILGRVDALVFTAGIGENSAEVRARCCEDLRHLGIKVDEAANQAIADGRGEIQSADSPVKVLVVPTDEELEIAQQTLTMLRGDCDDAGNA